MLDLKSNFFLLVVMIDVLSTFHFQVVLDVGLKIVGIGVLVDLFVFLFCLTLSLYFLFLILFLSLCLLFEVFDGSEI